MRPIIEGSIQETIPFAISEFSHQNVCLTMRISDADQSPSVRPTLSLRRFYECGLLRPIVDSREMVYRTSVTERGVVTGDGHHVTCSEFSPRNLDARCNAMAVENLMDRAGVLGKYRD